ncbi:MAG: ABC transporter permease [Gloeomargarita sp. SKYBB_i_bin120]|nr:ABC transporter permease [Gloeomargarita sp. SKYG98]MCS7291365.1 ABC transporter permease [Gloeomargarita sp. SKYB120]MDW8176924.1 ABC transporter permease [Gloeomargarita sp. SKYBB_i_bin120]
MSSTVTSTPVVVSELNPVADLLQETWALTRRLLIQLRRRPATLIAGVLQPLMWLILFGALFQKAPAGFLGDGVHYAQFLSAGIIVFTAFSGALNAGLPVMFDREFGFLNRFLVAPLVSRFSIILASTLFITLLSLVQAVAVMLTSYLLGGGLPDLRGWLLVVGVILLLVLGMTALSLGLTFALPSHVELLAVIFVMNLPLLFASTALAPLSFMPRWLQVIASLNPLSYAIEPIRHVYLQPDWHWSDGVLWAPWGTVTLGMAMGVLVLFDALAIASVWRLLQRKLS